MKLVAAVMLTISTATVVVGAVGLNRALTAQAAYLAIGAGAAGAALLVVSAVLYYLSMS